MKSHPNIAAINTHTRRLGKKKEKKSSPGALNPIITRRKDPRKVPPPVWAPHGHVASPRQQLVVTRSNPIMMPKAPVKPRRGWSVPRSPAGRAGGGRVAGAGGDLGHHWHIPRPNRGRETGGTSGTRISRGMLLAGVMGPSRVAGGPFPAVTGRAASPQGQIQTQEPLIPHPGSGPEAKVRSLRGPPA